MLEAVLVGLQQREAEAHERREERRQRHDADARRAQQVIDEALVEFDVVRGDLFDVLPDAVVLDRQGLLVVQHGLVEDHAHVEGPVGAVHNDVGDIFQNVEGHVGELFVAADPGVEVLGVLRVRHDPRDRHLGKRRRADLGHLLLQDGAGVALEGLVPFGVVELDPAAARAGPGKLLRDALQAHGGNVLDDVGERHGNLAVVDHIDVGLVEDEEQVVLPGDADDPLERLLVVDEARGVVGVDDENPHDRLVVLHLHLQLVHVRVPLVVRVHPVRVGRKRRVEHLGQEMGRVGRLRQDHPRVHTDRAVAACNGIPEPVEEENVLGRDLRLAAPVDQVGQKLPRLIHPLRGGVAEGLVLPDDLHEDILHPLRDLLAFLDGVPDVLPGHFHAAGLEPVRHPDDVADFVGQPVSSLGDVESHDDLLPARSGVS
ncbi:MAG: hypothetical protein BWX71_02673 [Deltaproteobacteria bacterium ADurb.Bin072]|nr:MAG: hypothetical protein BWX71_02673 [Deltaproteobacteria bacterium ADurb.Bin072]